MPEPIDILEIQGVRVNLPAESAVQKDARGRFLSVWFRCCHTYGRMYRNKAETEYKGRCPKCGAAVRALIASEGTSRRTFEAE